MILALKAPAVLGMSFLLLGFWYGLLLVLNLIPIGAVRAVLEDRVSREELTGYAACLAQVT